MTLRIYAASSWRNQYQQEIVGFLRRLGHVVYDFRNPAPGNHGFHWSSIDPAWQEWSPAAFRHALEHEIAVEGFASDKAALDWANVGVVILPSGRSAHLEAGYLAGQGKPVLVYQPEPAEPELMYKLLGPICLTPDELGTRLAGLRP